MKKNDEKMTPSANVASNDSKNDRKEENYEVQILKFWIDNNIFNKLKEHNAKGKPFYFLQGPPYTSGKIHLGQAWNNTIKDFIIKYKKMNGFDVWNRAGYDMHGLPTERKVQAELKLESKQDIIEYGLDKFSEKCYEWSEEKAQWMNDDLLGLGIDMDFENAYMPIKQEYKRLTRRRDCMKALGPHLGVQAVQPLLPNMNRNTKNWKTLQFT
jgi:isoleucyl-tRNA synthetase